jgi:uncharacterized delta-60 repeat protein
VFRVRAATGLGLLAAALVVGVGPAGAQPAVLDPSFGGGSGMVTTPIGSSAAADAVVLQPGGKIVAAGSVVQANNSQDFALARYQANGSLDTTFGSGGVVETPTGVARAVALQPDGKIVAAGTSSQIRVARYDADGSLDAAFGIGGVVTTQVGAGNSGANALLLQPDGKIVVGGESSDGSKTVFTLARYDASGSLDPTFGTGGIVTTQVGTGNSSIHGLALQPDGKIVADGAAMNGSQGVLAVARYDSDGSPDATFGSGGIATTAVGLVGENVSVGPVVLQPDGKIVATFGFALVRYETNGTLDPSFANSAGVTLIGGIGNPGTGLALQPDGKILLAGSDSSGATGTADLLRLARYNANGTPDGTFSNFGVAFLHVWTGSTDNPSPPASPAIALQPDGRIVAAGSHSVDGGNTQQFLVARFGAPTLTVNLISSAGNHSGTGGNITSNPPGIDCFADSGCLYPPNFFWQHAFAAGTVTLTATPWEGYLFAGWSGGDCSGTGPCQVQMSGAVSGDQSITATFTPAPTKALTVTKSGTGAGLITASGLFCRRTCTTDFVVGTKVTLTAKPNSDWSTFTGWSGDCSGKGTCTVTMNANHSVTATFQHFCIVPRLKGKTLGRARLSMRKAHCSLGRVTPVFSSKVKKGHAVAQKPAPRRRLVGRSRVRLEISKGPRHR